MKRITNFVSRETPGTPNRDSDGQRFAYWWAMSGTNRNRSRAEDLVHDRGSAFQIEDSVKWRPNEALLNRQQRLLIVDGHGHIR